LFGEKHTSLNYRVEEEEEEEEEEEGRVCG